MRDGMRAIAGTALANWRQRVRQPSFLVVLLASAALAHLAVPEPDSLWVMVNLGEYRPEYNSAYVGTAAALSGALWLSLAGFYVVGGIGEQGRAAAVAELVAASPLRGWAHHAGRFAGNLAVLATMAAALAAAAAAVQWARGEAVAVDPVALLLPFLVLTLPVLAVAAAAAVLADAVPRLRGGVGNLLWLPVWLTLVLAGQDRVLGAGPVAESLRAQLVEQGLAQDAAEFSVGLMQLDAPPQVFPWTGFALSGDYLAQRLSVVVCALLVALLPALWFRRSAAGRSGGAASGTPREEARPWRPTVYRRLAAAPGTGPSAFPRTVAARFRLLARTMPRWWWAVAAAVNTAALAVPAEAVPTVLLAAWIWPVLLWSALGTRHPGDETADELLAAAPARRRRVAAEWAAGVLLAALTGLGPLVRMAATGDWPGAAAWAGGALFVTALALLLGTVSGTRRLFQAGYVALWYLVFNGVSGVDFLGAVRDGGRLTGPSPAAVALAAAVLFAVAAAVAEYRHLRR